MSDETCPDCGLPLPACPKWSESRWSNEQRHDAYFERDCLRLATERLKVQLAASEQKLEESGKTFEALLEVLAAADDATRAAESRHKAALASVQRMAGMLQRARLISYDGPVYEDPLPVALERAERAEAALEDMADGKEIRCVVSGNPGVYECRTESLCVGCRARERVARMEARLAESEGLLIAHVGTNGDLERKLTEAVAAHVTAMREMGEALADAKVVAVDEWKESVGYSDLLKAYSETVADRNSMAEALAQVRAALAKSEERAAKLDEAYGKRCEACGSEWVPDSTIDKLSDLVEPYRQELAQAMRVIEAADALVHWATTEDGAYPEAGPIVAYYAERAKMREQSK